MKNPDAAALSPGNRVFPIHLSTIKICVFPAGIAKKQPIEYTAFRVSGGKGDSMTSLDTDFWLQQTTPAKQMAKSLSTANPKMLACLRLAEKCASSYCPVMITGESGVGKYLVAAYLHQQSPRTSRPLMTLKCTDLREGEVRDALFGSGKDCLPGPGGILYEAAGGTLVLRGVEQLSGGMQKELLALLHEYTRIEPSVNGDESGLGRSFGVRLVSTSSAGLGNMAASGLFLEELFFALGEVTLRVPPLRERREDVECLAEMALAVAARTNNAPIRSLSRSARDFLHHYPFPGNVRELFRMVDRATRLSESEFVYMEDLNMLAEEAGRTDGAKSAAPLLPLAELEKRHINKALLHTGWKKTAAARILHISETMLNRKIKIYGLDHGG